MGGVSLGTHGDLSGGSTNGVLFGRDVVERISLAIEVFVATTFFFFFLERLIAADWITSGVIFLWFWWNTKFNS